MPGIFLYFLDFWILLWFCNVFFNQLYGMFIFNLAHSFIPSIGLNNRIAGIKKMWKYGSQLFFMVDAENPA